MIERLLEREALGPADYIALEPSEGSRAVAAERLGAWAAARGRDFSARAEGFQVEGPGGPLDVRWLEASLFDDLSALPPVDTLLGHAVLDLLDLDLALPAIWDRLRPGGILYFSLTFDGWTTFIPEIDPALDPAILGAYHASMDARPGNTAGSRAGRRLIEQLQRRGADLIAIGASDWVIYPIDGAYPDDDAIVLQHLLDRVRHSVGQAGVVETSILEGWVEARRRQVETGRLTLVAHQLDVLGRRP